MSQHRGRRRQEPIAELVQRKDADRPYHIGLHTCMLYDVYYRLWYILSLPARIFAA